MSERDDDDPTGEPGFWIGLILGLPIVAFGAWGAWQHLPGVQLTSFLRFFVGGALVHDVLLAPAVCLLGWFVARRLPPTVVAPVQAALLATGIAGLVSWPFVRGYGVTEGEPSFLSRDYTASLVTIWAVIWAVAALWTTMRIVRARHPAPQ